MRCAISGRRQIEDPGDFPKIPAPALRALHGAGFFWLSDLAEVSDEDLLKLHGMGPKALGILRQALRDRAAAHSSGSAE